MHNSFLDLVEVHDSSANGLVKALKQSLETKAIPLETIVAFCANTTNVMGGWGHSFATILGDLLLNVIIAKFM